MSESESVSKVDPSSSSVLSVTPSVTVLSVTLLMLVSSGSSYVCTGSLGIIPSADSLYSVESTSDVLGRKVIFK